MFTLAASPSESESHEDLRKAATLMAFDHVGAPSAVEREPAGFLKICLKTKNKDSKNPKTRTVSCGQIKPPASGNHISGNAEIFITSEFNDAHHQAFSPR